MLHNLKARYRLFFALALLLALPAACNGETAQDFEVELFDGGRFRLSEQYADKVVVVNFWYPSCPPCREEMPEFQRAWEELDGETVRIPGAVCAARFRLRSNGAGVRGGAGTDFRFRHRP